LNIFGLWIILQRILKRELKTMYTSGNLVSQCFSFWEDTSGLPRALERLFIVCFGPAGLDGKNFFAKLETEKIVFASIFYNVMNVLDGQYNIKAYVRNNLQVATKLLSYCIEDTPVSGKEILDNKDSNTTIRSLERDKHIILSVIS
jgi:hypothetical protein